MIAVLKRPWVRVLLQGLVSLALIAALVFAARSANLLSSFRAISPAAVVLAGGLQTVGFALNSRRWQILLASAGISERLGNLTVLYFIGQFCSLFLPTGTGGDVVRTYEVARRNGRPAEAVLATLQERLLGLGASLLIGVVAVLYYLPLVPLQLRIWVLIIVAAGSVAIALLLYPRLLFALANWVWHAYGQRPLLKRLVQHRFVQRVIAVLRPIGELPPLPLARLLLLLCMALAAVLMGIGMYYVIGQSMGLTVGLMSFCLAVPLVWIVRMAPVSLNGIGVGEGSFVFLMSLFGIPASQSLALALAVLAVMSAAALAGGVLLAWRVARGSWGVARRIPNEPATGVAHEHR